MGILQITPDILKKVWDSSGEHMYCLNSGKICDSYEFSDIEKPDSITQTQYLYCLGYIPFVSVTNDEVLRAYAKTIDNKKVKEVMEHCSESDYTDVLWKYFNNYPDMLEDYKKFEDDYVLEKIENWCKSNSVEYEIL